MQREEGSTKLKEGKNVLCRIGGIDAMCNDTVQYGTVRWTAGWKLEDRKTATASRALGAFGKFHFLFCFIWNFLILPSVLHL